MDRWTEKEKERLQVKRNCKMTSTKLDRDKNIIAKLDTVNFYKIRQRQEYSVENNTKPTSLHNHFTWNSYQNS